jgi:oligo-1,6-glucosidase/alpha-glucosidase
MSEQWWRETTVYQIYPRSFFDASGDGIGDLDGIIAKLDYLKDLGVGAIWFSPFYASPQRDVGYDISDYRSIAPEYGDLDTVARLFDAVHARGMKVVLDMVMNHTSDRHPWFLESRSSRDNPKRDWYVWRDGRKPGGKAPPNNWNAMIGGSGWHYDPPTDQWYWTQFLPFQPDLNYRNPEVRAAMLDNMRFWLDRGADGFRLDIVNALFEDPEFRDNPFAWRLIPSDDDPRMLFQGSDRTLNHPDTLAFMRELRAVVDAYPGDRFLVGEVNATIEQARAHCVDGKGLNLVFLFRSLKAALNPATIRALVSQYERLFPDPLLPTWVFGNHDRARRISRLGGDFARAKLNAAWQLTARGVPFLYQGEEIGMVQVPMPARGSKDALVQRMPWVPQFVYDAIRAVMGESINRDECRTPMQWDASPTVGFCPPGAKPWLPPPADTRGRTVADQSGDPDSLLECYRRFLHARRAHPALHRGDLVPIDPRETGYPVVGWRRTADGRTVAVLLNASRHRHKVRNPAAGGTLLASTDGRRTDASAPELALGPWEGLAIDAP